MSSRSHKLKYVALVFMTLFFLSLAGFLIYMHWFSSPPEPPPRARPVLQVLTYLKKGEKIR